MTPRFIRYFAHTDGSMLGIEALSYLRALSRIAPVRLISTSGGLDGAWRAHEALQLTPMAGMFVNCVCADPSRWAWTQKVAMAKSDPWLSGGSDEDVARAMVGDDEADVAEVAEGKFELYTNSVRNVLFAVTMPRDRAGFATAQRYEAVIVRSWRDFQWMIAVAQINDAKVIPTPVTDHKAFRWAVLGDADA